jgi:hypothetical protein
MCHGGDSMGESTGEGGIEGIEFGTYPGEFGTYPCGEFGTYPCGEFGSGDFSAGFKFNSGDESESSMNANNSS